MPPSKAPSALPSTSPTASLAPSQSPSIIEVYAQLGSDLDGEFGGDGSGSAVALSFYGDTVAIGAIFNDGGGFWSGHVRVFSWDGLVWSQKGPDLDGASSGDNLGSSVALSADGDIVAAGAPGNSGGHVRVWKWADGLWSQLGDDILGESGGDESGYAISLSSDGTVLAVGARLNDGNGTNSGHVKVWEWTGWSWTQRGQTIIGEMSHDTSGSSVSMSSDGSLVAIGAPYNDGNGSRSGHVRVWEWSGSAWTQRGLDIDGQSSIDRSGRSVSMSGDGSMVAIGGHYNSQNGSRAGQVRVWEWDGSVWSQKGADLLGDASYDYFGQAVALSWDGSSLAIGAPRNDNGGLDSGHVKVFEWSGSSWESRGDTIVGEARDDHSGTSLAMSWNGGRLAVGAKENDGNGPSSGHVRVFEWTGVLPELTSQAPSTSLKPSFSSSPSAVPSTSLAPSQNPKVEISSFPTPQPSMPSFVAPDSSLNEYMCTTNLKRLGTPMIGSFVGNGNLFDVVAKETGLWISGLTVNLNSDEWVYVHVYTRLGHYSMDPADWTLLSEVFVQAKGDGQPTELGCFEPVFVPAYSTRSFWVQQHLNAQVSSRMMSTYGSDEGNSWWSNDDLEIHQGRIVESSGDLSRTKYPYVWNGEVKYMTQGASPTPPPTPEENGMLHRYCVFAFC